ncbi:amino acid permease [[Clostridium] cellulosi]|jgi:amino acid ABC transporter membrane protein 2, PAAT family (TC 3.A.1.3.-)|uniref:Amino acid permease n=1 Tax=[Clostridium] cellulosi TaxID=29343 RepID=A0A078KS77_9FIRM|nr:MAG: amino acid ABC transporter permease [[Clostridium] cellulosi]CDZ23964.1 amino acid permease [[Clostridium] cellulosi]
MPDLGIRVLFEGNNFLRLMGGLWVTVKISLLSAAISMLLGVLLGMVMALKNPITKCLTRIYLEFIRIMPQLVLLFLVYFGAAKTFNIDISGETAAVIVFVLWGTAEMGDLVRGALISIPKHQYESSKALGLSRFQTYRYVIIPQTLRRLIPLAINLVTRMIKTTSLIVLIGVVEVLKVGQQIIEANRYTAPSAALWIYGTIFFLYFAICYPISKLAGILEKRWQN